MKNILTTILLLLSLVSFSQTKVQLEVENIDGKEQYKLKLEREVDGKTVSTEKTYDSKEAMKNDPELEGLDLHIMQGDGLSFTSKEGGNNVIIKMEEESEGEDHKMMFFPDEEGGEDVNIKVTVDEDGNKHIFRNGEEVDIDKLHKEGGEYEVIFISEDGETKDLEKLSKTSAHKMIFVSEEGNGEGDIKIEVTVDEEGTKHIFKNGEEIDIEELREGGKNVFIFKPDGNDSLHIEEAMEVEVTVDEEGKHHVTVNGEEVDYEEWKENSELHMGSGKMEWVEEGGDAHLPDGQGQITKEIIIIKKEGEDQQEIKFEVIVQKMVLHLEDINEVDEKTFAIEENKALKLDEFNFYPNPNNGTFNLAFAGKEKVTVVRITDINGKEVYAENLQSFAGTYDKEISLSDLKKGIYLLQVVQGSKAVNKKIIIE